MDSTIEGVAIEAVGALPAVDQVPRAAVIEAAIRRAVTEQRLTPGTKLPEDQLGILFGASRTLVRAALQLLARDGVVVLARNKGASVASPSPEEARDVFEARRVVEAVTVARAAHRATPIAVADLDRLGREGTAALASGDRGRAIHLSGAFHLRIARMAGQSVLEGFLERLVDQSSLVIALYGHAGRPDCRDAEHRDLVTAIRDGDEFGAVALMEAHLRHIEVDLDFTRQGRSAVPLSAILSSSSMR